MEVGANSGDEDSEVGSTIFIIKHDVIWSLADR